MLSYWKFAKCKEIRNAIFFFSSVKSILRKTFFFLFISIYIKRAGKEIFTIVFKLQLMIKKLFGV